jgi:RIO kinase 2
MGSKNHEIVPLHLIVQISGLRNGGVNKLVGSLAKRNLVAKVQNAKCEDFSVFIDGHFFFFFFFLESLDGHVLTLDQTMDID